METNELKSAVEELGTAFEELKATNDEALAELSAGKDVDPILEEKMAKLDRKSVVQGKSVDLGGRRIIKKKKTKEVKSRK